MLHRPSIARLVVPTIDPLLDLRVVLRRYGFLAVDAASCVRRDDGWIECGVKAGGGRPAIRCLVAVAPINDGQDGWLSAGECLFDARRPRWLRRPVYRALLPFRPVDAVGRQAIWVDAHGRAVIAWEESTKTLWVGLRLSEEITRYVQGDPEQGNSPESRARFGFSWERPNYLYEPHLVPGYESEPWADRLGFTVVERLATHARLPLVEPIPHGGYGALLITGDDDQALLERYAKQLEVIDGLPITYYLHPLTKHTPETIAALPPNVEFGVHPDAVDEPQRYDELCQEQTAQMRQLCGRPARSVRNHGYLSDGYWGHLPAWNRAGLALDLNTPGVDGTALTGSLLPFQVRGTDGTWSGHYSLLTAFGDGMQEALGMTSQQAARRVRNVVRQVERRGAALLVINLHPMNIITTEPLHREVVAVGRRRGWTTLTAEGLLEWLQCFEQLTFEAGGDTPVLGSAMPVRGLAVRFPTRWGWKRRELPSWIGSVSL